jgi:methylthioribose-1-phosphate isomerase
VTIIPTVDYRRGAVEIIDQTLLPHEELIVRLDALEEAARAIESLRVRGAPAIGIAGAYGMLVALERYLAGRVRPCPDYFFDRGAGMRSVTAAGLDAGELRTMLAAARGRLAATRPTAVNLVWALERMMRAAVGAGNDAAAVCGAVANEAFAIHAEELEIEYAIGRNGEGFIRDGMNILTHCNAGGLATAGYGTALGVLYAARERGKRFHVYVDETRPLLQGARLTAWELSRQGIPYTLLCDGAAASLFASGSVDAAIVGADRIAANGDTANKIGTLGLAVLCEKFKKPLYVAAPWSTFDLRAASGRDIPIEERPSAEVVSCGGTRIAPEGAAAYNPAFDVTPGPLIAAIITERGVVEAPNALKIGKIGDSSPGDAGIRR